MTFSEYAFGLVGLNILYYSVLIATDIYKQSKMMKERNGEDREISIVQAVESYKPIDASSILQKEADPGYDEEDIKAGLDEPPADYDEEEEMSYETDNGEDIRVNNQGGIPAFRFKSMISDIAKEQKNFFAGCLANDAASL